jgi:hypothetical protein
MAMPIFRTKWGAELIRGSLLAAAAMHADVVQTALYAVDELDQPRSGPSISPDVFVEYLLPCNPWRRPCHGENKLPP